MLRALFVSLSSVEINQTCGIISLKSVGGLSTKPEVT
uniref:Uncharacterized protein n=1 Tax=Anguilla anguilla TaxID=7936 RepID=A0A0E9W394_ANGAN